MNFRDVCLAALKESRHKELSDYLTTNTDHNSFEILLDEEIEKEVQAALPGESLQRLITRSKTWNAEDFEPGIEHSNAELVLNILWQQLARTINQKLEHLRRHADLSANGAIICFPGGSKISILISYKDASTTGVGSLQPLSVAEDPVGMLELERLFENTQREEKSALKKAVISVDKITLFKSTMIHVDRQKDDVFGPTVDTVILANLLDEEIHSLNRERLSVLEVGPGSGLICVHAISLAQVSRICAVEINFPSVACTIKNFTVNDFRPNSKLNSISLRAEKFESSRFGEQFDYVVCNPPYIPESDDIENFRASGYGTAISGLELYAELFGALDEILAPEGKALFMASSVSLDHVESIVPNGYSLARVSVGLQRKVPLDLDLLWARPAWREELIQQGAIEVGDDGLLYHTLIPIWVTKDEGSDG